MIAAFHYCIELDNRYILKLKLRFSYKERKGTNIIIVAFASY